MTTANKITNMDMMGRAKGLLLSQFKDKPNINKVVEALIEEVQELDDSLIDLQQVRLLNNAYGVYLDEIGQRLKVPRTMLDDDDYRTAIKVRMLKNNSSGTLEDIEQMLSLLTYNLPHYIENTHPYVIELTAFLACLNTEEALQNIKSLFPMGVAVRIQNSTTTPFGFEGNPNAKGFSADDYSVFGGQICDLAKTYFGVSDDERFTLRKEPLPPPVDPNIPTQSSKPINSSPPLLSPAEGNQEGSVLSCSTGSWISVTPLSYTYQWFRGGNLINGTTASVYTVVAEDLGELINCRVSAENSAGISSTTSNSTSISEDPVVSTGVRPNLGLELSYYGQNYSTTEAAISITFNRNGTFSVVAANLLPNNEGTWADTVSADVGVDYEISYVASGSGDKFNTPSEFVYRPLSSGQSFILVARNSAVDKSTEAFFTIRRISDQVEATGTSVFSISCIGFLTIN